MTRSSSAECAPGFVEDGVGNADLADVVQRRGGRVGAPHSRPCRGRDRASPPADPTRLTWLAVSCDRVFRRTGQQVDHVELGGEQFLVEVRVLEGDRHVGAEDLHLALTVRGRQVPAFTDVSRLSRAWLSAKCRTYWHRRRRDGVPARPGAATRPPVRATLSAASSRRRSAEFPSGSLHREPRCRSVIGMHPAATQGAVFHTDQLGQLLEHGQEANSRGFCRERPRCWRE